MGEVILARRGGATKRLPGSYQFLQLLTATGSWTVPTTAWYKVYCVGKSGNGGSGLGNKVRAGGGGGGSGGVSVSVLHLRAGTTISVTINTSVTSFDGYHYATAGTDGGNAAQHTAGAGGAPGQGYSGNFSNDTGRPGGAGGGYCFYGENSDANTGGASLWYAEYPSGTGGGGGGGGDLRGLGGYFVPTNKYGGNGALWDKNDNFQAPTRPWSAPATLVTPPLFYGGGGGMGGGGDQTVVNPALWPGGNGTPGGIIIERGVG